VSCTACGHPGVPGLRYCGNCGAALLAEGVEPERRQVSVLFSDLSGYTALSEALDAEDVRAVVNEVLARAAGIVVSYRGRVEKVMGDAILAVFGDPVAHEDDAERAVRAALTIHAAVAELGVVNAGRLGRTLSMHSGINTGVVVTGEPDISGARTGPTGDPVNIAARIQGLAGADEILIGPETVRLVRGTFILEDRGARELKGRSGRVSVARVVGFASTPERRSALRGEFVGRSTELGALFAAADRLRQGEPSTVLVTADSGVGKSRLVEEFRNRTNGEIRCLTGRATALAQNTPYSPVIDLLSTELTISDRDSLDLVRDKLRMGVRELVDDPLVLAPLEQLYGIVDDSSRADRETFPERLLAAVRAVLAHLAGRAPLVLIVEDLHWADAASVELLQQLLAPADLPVLAILTSRPERSLSLPSAHVLALSELNAAETSALLVSLLAAETVPEDVRDFVVARTDGNPFFVEELTSSLLETGALHGGQRTWELKAPLTESIPATVRGVLAARIDRLTDDEKRVVREAAVIGREFPHRILRGVTEINGALDRAITSLQTADIIRIRVGAPELQYTFKHALTQEVAYAGLSRNQRRRIHARVGAVIERELADRRSEVVEVLAHHYREAEMVDEAVSCLIEAGRKSVEQYALTEAHRFLSEGHALLTDRQRSAEQDRTLIDLVNTWSFVHYYRGTIDEWVELLRAHLSVAEHIDDLSARSLYLACLGNALWFNGDLRGSLDALDRALALQPADAETEGSRHARAWRAHTLMMMGRLTEAEAIEVPRGQLSYPVFKGMSGVAFAATFGGHLVRARQLIDELLRLGKAAGNPRAEAIGCVVECAWRWTVLDPDAGESAVHGLEAARDDIYRASNAFPLALSLITDGRYAEARDLTEVWLPKMRARGNYWIAAVLEVIRSAADVALGRMSAGMRDLLRTEAELQARGYAFPALVARLTIARVHILVARREVDVKASWLLRNPWFVARHAMPAERRAKQELESLRRDAVAVGGFNGFLGNIDLSRAQIYSRAGDTQQAREAVANVKSFLAEAGVQSQSCPAVDAIEAELAHRT
jgi:class 3 adenylate cyclase/tetratricopeptide (TPR) repeat protein